MDNVSYLSNANLSERKTIIWNPSGLVREIEAKYGIKTGGCSNRSTIDNLMSDLNSRSEQILKFLSFGGNLIIINNYLENISYYNVSGALMEIELMEKTVLQIADPLPADGVSVSVYRDGVERDYLSKMCSDLKYNIIIRDKKINPIFIVPNTNDTIGGFVKTKEDGLILFLPPRNELVGEEGELFEGNENYYREVLSIPSKLRQESTGTEYFPPSWVDKFRLFEEQDAFERIGEHEAEIIKININIKSEREKISSLEPFKKLFSANGSVFEESVLEAFHTIGMKTSLGPKSHCDVIAVFEKTIFAIEAKGLNRGARPGHANQCMRWIADIKSALGSIPEERDDTINKYVQVLDQLGVPIPSSEYDDVADFDIKGLFVINAHCTKPIDERDIKSEPAINDSVVRILCREKLCALTGLQLLGIVLELRSGSANKEEILEKLLNTNGVLEGYDNWEKFLHHTE